MKIKTWSMVVLVIIILCGAGYWNKRSESDNTVSDADRIACATYLLDLEAVQIQMIQITYYGGFQASSKEYPRVLAQLYKAAEKERRYLSGAKSACKKVETIFSSEQRRKLFRKLSLQEEENKRLRKSLQELFPKNVFQVA